MSKSLLPLLSHDPILKQSEVINDDNVANT